jgi:hypothetical protein
MRSMSLVDSIGTARMYSWKLALVAALAAIASCDLASAEEFANLNLENGGSPIAGISASAIELGSAARLPDPCFLPEITASPSRPTWTGGAATTQCGVMESDFGWQWQPMGYGASQTVLASSMRYGLSPRMDMRWGLPAHITQGGDDSPLLKGISDQSFSVLYRFHDQSARTPALGLSYGVKIPSANPGKGFGSGYTDHQVALITSRDFGRVHADFNAVGIVAGAEERHDGALQCGLALSMSVTRSITWLVDSFGGTQPGTLDRFGTALTGISWSLRPRLVVDASYAQAYTAGAPRQQVAAGFTYSMRPGLGLIPLGSRLGRLVGR